jgi:hypothetical protein
MLLVMLAAQPASPALFPNISDGYQFVTYSLQGIVSRSVSHIIELDRNALIRINTSFIAFPSTSLPPILLFSSGYLVFNMQESGKLMKVHVYTCAEGEW